MSSTEGAGDERPAVPQSDGSGVVGYGAFGWALIAVGLGLIAWAFSIAPSVSVADYGTLGIDRVNNTGLMNQKLMLTITGSGFLVAGSIFACRR